MFRFEKCSNIIIVHILEKVPLFFRKPNKKGRNAKKTVKASKTGQKNVKTRSELGQ
jgi:hypothetical protein